jgi:hypothetical protein
MSVDMQGILQTYITTDAFENTCMLLENDLVIRLYNYKLQWNMVYLKVEK